MRTTIIYGVTAAALALSSATAFAQTKQTGPIGQYDQGSAQTLTPSSNQYNQGSAQTLTPSSNQYNQGSAQTLTPSSNQYNQGSASTPQKSQ